MFANDSYVYGAFFVASGVRLCGYVLQPTAETAGERCLPAGVKHKR